MAEDKEEETRRGLAECEQILETLATPGWELIKARFQEAYDDQDHLVVVNNERDLYRAQGRLITLAQIINIRDLIKKEIEYLENPPEDVSLEEDTFSGDFVERVGF